MIDAKEDDGTMPDWRLGYKHNKKPKYAFFFEVKRPNTPSVYQADDDYVKLMKQMKESINMQVNLGVEEPKSFGLLVEGWRCKLYMMQLVEDGLYLAAMIKRFWLVEEVEQVVNIPSIIEGLLFVKAEPEIFTEKFLLSATLAFNIGDIPACADLCGHIGHQAYLGCRICKARAQSCRRTLCYPPPQQQEASAELIREIADFSLCRIKCSFYTKS